MVDDLHGDPAAGGLRESAGDGRVHLAPRGLVDFRLQRALEPVVRVLADEVGLSDEEALLVIVVIDEPSGDIVLQVGPASGGRR